MESCPECGPLDELARHHGLCRRAVQLGLPRLADGEEPIPAVEAPEPAPAAAPQRRARGAAAKPGEPRVFAMVRNGDQSGVSGIGRVLDGIVWGNGKVTVCWRTQNVSIAVYDSFEVFEAIHITPHPDNGTEIEWADERVTRALAALQQAVGA